MRSTLAALSLLISSTSFAYLSHHTAYFEGQGSYHIYKRNGLERDHHRGHYRVHTSITHKHNHNISVTNTYLMKDKTHSVTMLATPKEHKHPYNSIE